MNSSPPRSIKLFGTEQPVEPMKTLTAGPLSAEFDQGALRFIKINGAEAIRNLAFIVRDRDWGTYNPAISNLKIEQGEDSFQVQFDAVCKDDEQELHYVASIVGRADGSLTFTGNGKAITDFVTNRTGFVVLHPVTGVSGFAVETELVDGSVVQSEFPELVDPVQPFKDLRAMTHEVMPGVKVTCRMEGDTFETEDHRQWNDASYKTYVRPIGLPWPFTINAGEVTEQSVTLNISGTLPATSETSDSACTINIGTTAQGQMPAIGIGLEPQHADATLEHVELLSRLNPHVIVCWHDLGAGHGAADIAKASQVCDAANAEMVLEAVLPCVDYRAEINTLAQQVKEAGAVLSAVCVSPSEYLKSIMPGTTWPDVPELADIYDATREAFPGIAIGGGMHAYFPELNRKRPPTAHIDFISHTSNTITHACDDITVTENLEAIPYIIKTCRSFADGKPYRVGPSSIGMRFNPYGSRTMDNPDNGRIAMARMEPRQRGLINAAWTIGYTAHMARGDVDVVTLQAAVGEFGLIYHPMDWSQPWYDNAGAAVFPAYHAVATLAGAAGNEKLNTESSNSHDVECIAWRNEGATTVVLANLTQQSQSVKVTGLPTGSWRATTLDESSFMMHVTSSDAFDETGELVDPQAITLPAYAIARLSAN